MFKKQRLLIMISFISCILLLFNTISVYADELNDNIDNTINNELVEDNNDTKEDEEDKKEEQEGVNNQINEVEDNNDNNNVEKVILTIDVNGGNELESDLFEIEKGKSIKDAFDKYNFNKEMITNSDTTKEFDNFYDNLTDGNVVNEDTVLDDNLTIYVYWKDKVVETNEEQQEEKQEQQEEKQEQEEVKEEQEEANVPEVIDNNNIDTTISNGTASVSYTTHVQSIGWQEYVQDGAMAGTSGRSFRLEGIKIKLLNQEYSGNVEYRTHIQKLGWEDGFKKNDEISGTTGLAYRLEAIEIKLTGEIADHYDIYYRVHAQHFGWLGWARNGESSGTAGYAYRLEGIEVLLKPKGEIFADYGQKEIFYNQESGSIKPISDNIHVSYTTHVQSVGWQEYVRDGDMAGTSGQALRLEGIKIKLLNQDYTGDIEYRTHIQKLGWEDEWKKNDEMSGTSGLAYRLEAIQMRLTGELADHYDIYYRVHAQHFGWLGWARNGESSGTAGYAYRLEGIEIKLVEKGVIFSDYGASTIFYDKQDGETRTVSDGKLLYISTYIQSNGWQNNVEDGNIAGTTGVGLNIEAIKLNLVNPSYSGDIEYKSYIQARGWESSFKKNDEISGTVNNNLRIEAIQIRLTGEIADHYDIYYRVHSRKFGWLGWAKNGEEAGTTGYGYRIEAIETKMVPKGELVEGYGTTDAFKDYGGWQVIDGKTYYIYADGSKATSFAKIDGVRYEFSNSGELQHSNIKIIADLSYHNGTVNFDELWNSGQIDGIIFRIGWSLGMDRKFVEYSNEAKRLGIPYSVYHFSIAENGQEATDEATYLLRWYQNNNVNADMGVFYDLEEWHNDDYTHSDATITPEKYDEIIKAYKAKLNENGLSVSVYAGKNFAETRFTDYGRSQVSWIAQYNYRCTYGGTYRGWQFTSTATLPGINGYVDLSVFYY